MQLKQLFSGKKREEERRADALYRFVLDGALRPSLYEHGVAADTFDGRFEQVALHGALLMRHLRRLEEPGRVLAQKLYEKIFSGFDHAYRETGVGDSSISRKVRGLGERFFGLARGLDQALDEDQEESQSLTAFIDRNQLGADKSEDLVFYLRCADKGLSQQVKAPDGLENMSWPELKNGVFEIATSDGSA